MNTLSFLEVEVVVSTTLQLAVMFLSLYLYLHFPKPTRRPFLWLTLSFFMVAVRRVVAMLRFSSMNPMAVLPMELEYLINTGNTVLWIMFILEFMRNTNGSYVGYGKPQEPEKK